MNLFFSITNTHSANWDPWFMGTFCHRKGNHLPASDSFERSYQDANRARLQTLFPAGTGASRSNNGFRQRWSCRCWRYGTLVGSRGWSRGTRRGLASPYTGLSSAVGAERCGTFCCGHRRRRGVASRCGGSHRTCVSWDTSVQAG
jgi:hypothetical protein